VRRGSGESAREIAAVQALADDLGPTDGVLIYPEGTRFTRAKRARALARLTERSPELVPLAARLRHVLPPHLGGPLGLLERERDADVVFCAHVGLEAAGSPRELLRGTLVGSAVHVRFWRIPRSEVPVDRADRIAWLYAQWQRVDDWIGEVHPPSG
jgi:hypothetical protein